MVCVTKYTCVNCVCLCLAYYKGTGVKVYQFCTYICLWETLHSCGLECANFSSFMCVSTYVAVSANYVYYVSLHFCSLYLSAPFWQIHTNRWSIEPRDQSKVNMHDRKCYEDEISPFWCIILHQIHIHCVYFFSIFHKLALSNKDIPILWYWTIQ